MSNNRNIVFEGARAGYDLKNRLNVFLVFFYFFICDIHGIPSIFMWKNTYMYLNVILLKISILIYASNLEFFVWNIQGKTLLFAINFDSKNKENVKLWKIYEWLLYWYCLYSNKKKMGGGGVTVETLNKCYLKLCKCVKWAGVILKCSKNMSGMLCSLNQS